MLPPKFPPMALVAHRGMAAHYPENTWLALARAVDAGASIVEFDIQLSRDGVAMVIHDELLARTCGRDGRVGDFDAVELDVVACGHDQQFGSQFSHLTIDRLAEVAARLSKFEHVFTLAELKEESVDRFGLERCMQAIYSALAPIRERTVIISFAAAVVARAKQDGWPTGWCLETHDNGARNQAVSLAPDLLLVDADDLSGQGDLWEGSWQWAAWEIVEPSRATALMELGVNHVESFDIARLLRDADVVTALSR